MLGFNLDRYEEPVGQVAQRIAGGFLCLASGLVAGASVIGLIHGGERFLFGEPWVNLVFGSLTIPCFAFSIGLLRAEPLRLRPRVLVASGALLIVGTAWLMRELAANSIGTKRAPFGFVLGITAIGLGVRKLRMDRDREI